MNNERLSLMYEQGKIRYYISGMVTRQIFSRNSNFYKEYGRYEQSKSPLDASYERIPGDED